MRDTERVRRLLRVPAVLAFAALWAWGSYALGFAVFDEHFPLALGTAFAGGVLVALALGSLVGRPAPVLLALPLAIGALTTSVYAAGIHHMRTVPSLTLVVAGQRCEQVCEYTFRGVPDRLRSGERHDAGETVRVYRTAGGELRWWPAAMLRPERPVRTAARITGALLAAYTLVLGVAGALGDAATVRRFHQHMASSGFSRRSA